MGYAGLNLLWLQTTLEEPMATFVVNGKAARVVLLKDLVSSVESLPRTVSHRAWGSVRGFNEANQLVIEVAGKQRLFNAATGVEETRLGK